TGVTVDLSAGTASGAGADLLLDVENAYGGAGSDILYGNDLTGGSLLGQAGADIIYGSDAEDYVDGGLGNDTVFLSPGNDTAFGGAGIDTLDYSTEVDGVFVNLPAHTVLDGYGDIDQIAGFEVILGTENADTMFGNADDN